MKRTIAIIISIMFVLAFTLPATAISTIAVTGISLENSKVTLRVGETSDIKVTFTPENTTQTHLTYSSSDKYVATVDKNGKITPVHGGRTRIFVRSQNRDINANIEVIVEKPSTDYVGSQTCLNCHKNKAGSEMTKHHEAFQPLSAYKISEPLGTVTVFDGSNKNAKSTKVDLTKTTGVMMGEYIVAEIPKEAGFLGGKYYRVAKLSHSGEKISVVAAANVTGKTDWSASAYTCASCHTPGLDLPGKADLTVSCETCHGPGGEHSTAKLVAKKATITKPTSAVCVKCHTGGTPTKDAATGIIVTNNHQGARNWPLSTMAQNTTFKGCTECHNVHASNAKGKMLKKDDPNDVCLTCHTYKQKKYDLGSMMWVNPKDSRGHFTLDHSFGELPYDSIGDDPNTDATEITKPSALNKVKAVFPDLFKK